MDNLQSEKSLVNVMVDIETLSLQPSAAVLAVAAVAFNMENGTIGEHFFATLDVVPQLLKGRSMEETTVYFWHNLPEKDKEWLTEKDKELSPDNALWGLLGFLQRVGEGASLQLWAQGSDFDFPILRSLSLTMLKTDIFQYFDFHNIRDVRSAVWAFSYCPDDTLDWSQCRHKFGKDSQKHHPLNDCMNSIQLLCAACHYAVTQKGNTKTKER